MAGEIIVSDMTGEHVADETGLLNLMSKAAVRVHRSLVPFSAACFACACIGLGKAGTSTHGLNMTRLYEVLIELA